MRCCITFASLHNVTAQTSNRLSVVKPRSQGLPDLITENEDGVSVMTYMRSLYPHDWDNFLVRHCSPGSFLTHGRGVLRECVSSSPMSSSSGRLFASRGCCGLSAIVALLHGTRLYSSGRVGADQVTAASLLMVSTPLAGASEAEARRH